MKQTKELFAKQMTRKEFLQLAGVAILTLVGVTNFVSTIKSHLNNSAHGSKVATKQADHGFGSRKFGA